MDFLCHHPYLSDVKWLNTQAYIAAHQRATHGEKHDYHLLEPYQSMAVLSIAYPAQPVSHQGQGYGRMARYTYGEDYHRVFARVFKTLEHRYQDQGVVAKGYADVSPIDERLAAALAGLGYIGHNQMLIHPKLGTWHFLGVLLVDLPTPNHPVVLPDDCGACRLCIEACPTGALKEGFNARQCSSFVTQAKIPLTLDDVKPLKSVLFGCDICQKVCPKNSHVIPPNQGLFEPDAAAQHHLQSLLSQSNKSLQKMYGSYAFMFRGALVLKRNAFALLYNQNHLASLPLMKSVQTDYAHVPWFAEFAQWIIAAMEAKR